MQFALDFENRLPPSAQIGMKQADDHADPKRRENGAVLAMPRIHLLISPSPPLLGSDLQAVCGAFVLNAIMIPEDVAQGKITVLFCKRCFLLRPAQIVETPYYSCAIVSGEESLHP